MVVQQWRRLVLYDIVLNVVVIGSVVVAARLGGSFLWFDAAAGLLVSCFMLFHALRILRSSVWELSDRALEEEIQLSILRGLVLKFDDFDDLIDVRSRRLAGHPHIDVILGFNAGRRWDDIVLRCATVRDSIESQVRGARVKVLPASAELWRRGGAKDAPASAAHPPPPDTTMMVTRVPHLT
jgi:divalent metal cation (Fe/Co/Zn/Cd) transporter